MSAERLEKNTDDDAFAARLADLDDNLAAGNAPPIMLPARLKRGVAALKALRKMRPEPLPAATIGQLDTPYAGIKPTGDLPTHLGRYHIVRELGRGGFGIVFLAHDPRLQRDVALKVPHSAALLDERLRERFRREARATAGLAHPNIVPLFDVDENGPILAIVSAYCPGMTLAEWLAQRTTPVPATDAAKLMAALADGVEHAHRQGVLHRDLKPANVMMTMGSELNDATLTPKITDFGLAKFTDDPTNVTMSGAILGTPSYMAPEQARGKAGLVDQRADVYSLGALLYEMLVGRPPFRGESDVDTLQLVTTTEPVAPRHLRPKLPRNIETVCLRALQKEPNRRYASAAELRDDLRRFLDGKPVVARPVSVVERVGRWCRRHPSVAGLVAALVAAIALGSAGMYREYRRANAERSIAVAAQEHSGRLLGKASDTLQEMITLGQNLVHHPKTVDEGISILNVARQYFRQILAEGHGNEPIRRQAATICRRLALLQRNRGKVEDAEVAWLEAMQYAEELHADHPDDQELFRDLVRMHFHQAEFYRDSDRIADAHRIADQAVSLVEKFRATHTDTAETLWMLGELSYMRGQNSRAEKQWREADVCYRAALAINRQLTAQDADPKFVMGILNGLNRLMHVNMECGRLDEAETAGREALALGEKALALYPRDDRPAPIYAGSQHFLGNVMLQRGRWDEAIDLYRASNRRLAPEIPVLGQTRGFYRIFLRSAVGVAQATDKLGRPMDAIADLRQAVAITPGPSKPNTPVATELLDCCSYLLKLLPPGEERDNLRARAEQLVTETQEHNSHQAARDRLLAAQRP